MRRFLSLALVAAALVVIPAGSAVAACADALSVTAVDTAADTVQGTAPVGAEVLVEADGYWRLVVADLSGVWFAEFSVSGGPSPDEAPFDIRPGSSGRAAVLATPPCQVLWEAVASIDIDETLSSYTVDRVNLCDASGLFQDSVVVRPLAGGPFTMEGGTAVDIKVTFNTGLVVRPGAESFSLAASLDPVGESISGGTEFSAQMIMGGTNIQSSFSAQAFVTVNPSEGVGANGEKNFVVKDSFLVNSASTGRIDSFQTTFTVPVGTTAGTVEAHVRISALGFCSSGEDPDPLLLVAPDTEPPVLTLPPDSVWEATGPGGATVTFTVSATDNSDPVPFVSCDPASGSVFPIAVTNVDCTATDVAGNSSSGSFTVTVVDTTPPTILVPEDISEVTASLTGLVVAYDVFASDVADASPDVDCGAWPSPSKFPLGVTTVTCTATDSSGNSAGDSFTVTVELVVGEETFDEVIDDVEALDLPNGTENSLLSSLRNADKSYGKGDIEGACDKLTSLLNKIDAQDGKHIEPADAATLREAVQAMIAAIDSCNGA